MIIHKNNQIEFFNVTKFLNITLNKIFTLTRKIILVPSSCTIDGKLVKNPSKRQRTRALLDKKQESKTNTNLNNSFPQKIEQNVKEQVSRPRTPDIQFSCSEHIFYSPKKKICKACIIQNYKRKKLLKKLKNLF